VTGRRESRRKQPLDERKETRGFRILNAETLARTLCRTRRGKGRGPVVRQTTRWWWYDHNDDDDMLMLMLVKIRQFKLQLARFTAALLKPLAEERHNVTSSLHCSIYTKLTQGMVYIAPGDRLRAERAKR